MVFLNRFRSGKEEGLPAVQQKTWSTSAGSIPGQEPKTPHALWPKQSKTQNKSNVVTNPVKILQNGPHTHKHLKWKRRKRKRYEEDRDIFHSPFPTPPPMDLG